MKRFFGMIPCDEIKIEKKYKDRYGKKVIIDVAEHGWTIIYSDGSTNYKDEDLSTDENFKNAFSIANDNVGPLIEE